MIFGLCNAHSFFRKIMIRLCLRTFCETGAMPENIQGILVYELMWYTSLYSLSETGPRSLTNAQYYVSIQAISFCFIYALFLCSLQQINNHELSHHNNNKSW